MSNAIKTIFGGTDDSSQKAQKGANKVAKAFIEKQTALARSDANRLFPQAQQRIGAGTQAAIDINAQAVPASLAPFQQGNVQAQQALLAGLPQIQNALLGMPVDMGALQPQQVNYDASFLQQQLPQLLSGQVPQQAPTVAQTAPAQFHGSPLGGFNPDKYRAGKRML